MYDDLIASVPKHATHISACVQCKRVANAFCTDGGQQCRSCFNEIGLSASMASTDYETMEVHTMCAKRPSASMRTAVSHEKEMSNAAIECVQFDSAGISAMISSSSNAGNGAGARMKRDAKSSLQQRASASACGQEHMLIIPMIGRAVCLWGEWYAMCSYCGVFMRVHPSNRFHSELCCLRCDYDMLNRRNANKTLASTDMSNAAPRCRFCGKVR